MRAPRIAPLALLLSLALVGVAFPGVALADIAPDCSDLDAYAGCDAADAGKGCDAQAPAAICTELPCKGGFGNAYKCVVRCEDVVPKGTGVACSPGQKECAGGTCKSYEGTCYGNLNARLYCDGGAATGGAGGSASGDGGGAGATAGVAGASAGGASSGAAGAATTPAPAAEDSGCAVSAAGKRGMLASLVTVAGALALFASRRRRERLSPFERDRSRGS